MSSGVERAGYFSREYIQEVIERSNSPWTRGIPLATLDVHDPLTQLQVANQCLVNTMDVYEDEDRVGHVISVFTRQIPAGTEEFREVTLSVDIRDSASLHFLRQMASMLFNMNIQGDDIQRVPYLLDRMATSL